VPAPDWRRDVIPEKILDAIDELLFEATPGGGWEMDKAREVLEAAIQEEIDRLTRLAEQSEADAKRWRQSSGHTFQ
jgi:CHASE3 domain sensor protein